MKNIIEQFKSLASQADVAAAAAADKKTLTNSLAWLSFFILKDATIQDKVHLGRMVAKDGTHEQHKGQVSKGRSVLEFLAGGGSVALKDGSIVTMESLKEFSSDNLPTLALSSIYAGMKKDKPEADASELARKEAEKLLSERHGLPVVELKKLLGADYDSELKACVAEVQASIIEAKRAAAVESVPSIIAALANLPAHAVQEVINAAKALLAADADARNAKVA